MARHNLIVEAVMAEAAYTLELVALLKGDAKASYKAAQEYRKAAKRLMTELGYSESEIEQSLFSDEKTARDIVFAC